MAGVSRLIKETMTDILGGILTGAGIYSFAAGSGFQMAGVSGIALIIYRLTGIPIGRTILLLNVPIAAVCFKFLGKRFFLRSVRTLIIASFITDYIIPLFPVYTGDKMLAAICTGVLSGLGYALIFMNNSSTGGMDFITLSIRAKKPHISLGRIVFILDCMVVIAGAFVFRDIDAAIYGLMITWILTTVIDKTMYGIDAGKMTLIVTEQGELIGRHIDEHIGRGSTILKGKGSHTGTDKDIVLCACNNKQMYSIRSMVKEIDPKAFTIIVESNEVVGEGFKKS
ncbi:MAG: YitT family protein [Schaedlerella sp.]|nr:YitT family protein [Lachnospiraceae bacterium]MDY4203499.1 YitT family protein [Schaedlerella sp.]